MEIERSASGSSPNASAAIPYLATNVQFDVFVDFNGGFVRRDLDQPTLLEGVDVGPVPGSYIRLPGLLHAYYASVNDLRGTSSPIPAAGHAIAGTTMMTIAMAAIDGTEGAPGHLVI